MLLSAFLYSATPRAQVKLGDIHDSPRKLWAMLMGCIGEYLVSLKNSQVFEVFEGGNGPLNIPGSHQVLAGVAAAP